MQKISYYLYLVCTNLQNDKKCSMFSKFRLQFLLLSLENTMLIFETLTFEIKNVDTLWSMV